MLASKPVNVIRNQDTGSLYVKSSRTFVLIMFCFLILVLITQMYSL